jgi:hypothetical protein
MRLVIVAALALPAAAPAQTPLQPFAQAVRALESALAQLGEPLPPEDKRRINDALARADEEAAVAEIESVLDAHTLAIVEINPESRVKVTQGRARPALVQGGTRAFLVKVINDAGVTAPLAVDSPNSAPVSISSSSSGGSPEPPVTVRPEDVLDRADGDVVRLPAGTYSVSCSRGPEYLSETKELQVSGPAELSFSLSRWIDPAKLGWYSDDHHIHAAGCSHYDNPTQGVTPLDMWRQVQGEALNVGSVLTWGPLPPETVLQRDGSSALDTRPPAPLRPRGLGGSPRATPGTWCCWGSSIRTTPAPGASRTGRADLPILRWAKAQGAVAGFAHSGLGLLGAATSFRTTTSRASTASGPTSTWSTSRTPAASTSSPRGTRRIRPS